MHPRMLIVSEQTPISIINLVKNYAQLNTRITGKSLIA